MIQQTCRVTALLDSGHDPAASDSQGRKAYWLCKFKSTRDAFRRHMAAHPEAWVWAEAGVHDALTPDRRLSVPRRRWGCVSAAYNFKAVRTHIHDHCESKHLAVERHVAQAVREAGSGCTGFGPGLTNV